MFQFANDHLMIMFDLSILDLPSSRSSSPSPLSSPMKASKLALGRPLLVSVFSKSLCVTLMLALADWLTFESLPFGDGHQRLASGGFLNRAEAALWPVSIEKKRRDNSSMNNPQSSTGRVGNVHQQSRYRSKWMFPVELAASGEIYQ